MKKILIISAILIIAASFLFSYSNEVCNNFLRIHIIANSNSDYDQKIKMDVRNYLFSKHENDFSKLKSKGDSIKYIKENKSKIEKEINDYLLNTNYNKTAHISLVNEPFPERQYKNFTLPKGRYDAVKIVIGTGKGKNFFCVMFPPVCVSDSATDNTKLEDILTKEELSRLKKGNIIYKSKIEKFFKSL